MTGLRAVALWCVCVALVVGCRTVSPGLEGGLGGPDGVARFLSEADEADIQARLQKHGIGYKVHELIDDCPQYFPVADRNTWHSFNGEHYFVDASGRPQKAFTYLPPIVREPRNSSCQASVGRWGDAENPNDDYEGGHLIGSQLGGWPKRANLVPQDLNFNRGNWAQLENKMARCDGLDDGRMLYSVRADYGDATTLIPGTIDLYLKDLVEGDSIWLDFDNVHQGGAGGTDERNAGVDFSTANGCN